MKASKFITTMLIVITLCFGISAAETPSRMGDDRSQQLIGK
jgi:hypothetical protein